MKLRAKKRFHIRGSNFIEVGEIYTTTKGRAEEQIRNGVAEKVEEQQPQEEKMFTPSENKAVEAAAGNYENMTVNELRNLARAKNVEGAISRLNKNELINAIEMTERGEV